MNNKNYIQANKAMWNQTADVYRQEKFDQLLAQMKQPDFSTFDEVEREVFGLIGLKDKAVAQLGCNNGRELISVKKAGAGHCVGFDLSENLIEQAKELAAASHQEVDFVCASIYDIDDTYSNSFDVIYITIGMLGWLPDLPQCFQMIDRLLRPGGHFFLYDMHPIITAFHPEKNIELDFSYFSKEPHIDETLPEYMDPSQSGKAKSYWFQHTLSDIIGQCIDLRLNLIHFKEYERDLSMIYKAFEEFEHKLPLSYSLVARKN